MILTAALLALTAVGGALGGECRGRKVVLNEDEWGGCSRECFQLRGERKGGCDIVDNCRTKEAGYLFKAYQCDVCECDCLTRCHEGTCGYDTTDMDEQEMRDLLRGKPQVYTTDIV